MQTEMENILDKINWPKKNTGLQFKGQIESKIGFRLPEDYIQFLMKYSGSDSYLKDSYFVLWDENDLLRLNDGYAVQYYLPNVLAIGSNGGGEMIALEHQAMDEYRIILLPFGSMKQVEYQIVIGDSFTDFLRRMDNGESWFK